MNVGARSVTQSNAAADSNLLGHARAPKNSPLVCVNVSGGVFYMHTSDLALHPDSLLAQPDKLEEHFEQTLNSYFFDRNRQVFEFIATFYQTGKLNFPAELDKTLIERELDYFGLQALEVDNIAKVEKVVTMRKTVKSRIHQFLADPSSSRYAAAWAALDIAFIMISIICFILETEPGYKKAFQDPSHSWFLILQWLDMVVAVFFTIDFIMRGCSWPTFKGFITSSQNIIDLLSLVPFYAQLFLSKYMIINFGKILRVLRIFRVIKLFKYFADIFLIIAFVCNAWQEIILIAMLTGILLILFGSLIYFAEYDPNRNNHPPVYSIMQGLWWSMVTITTVGYGDVCPETLTGRFFGSILVIISMVVLTLPMTVVISKFNRAYEHESRQSEKLVLLDGYVEDGEGQMTASGSGHLKDNNVRANGKHPNLNDYKAQYILTNERSALGTHIYQPKMMGSPDLNTQLHHKQCSSMMDQGLACDCDLYKDSEDKESTVEQGERDGPWCDI